MKVVVLGAGGFLGASMARYLAMDGHQVIAYWRQPRPEIARLENVTSMVGDIRDSWIISDAFEDTDVVYHFASSTYPSLFYSDPTAEYAEALQPLLVVMETAAYRGVKKIVFPSSGGTVYADSDQPRTEDSPTNPRSPYAVFKLAAEQLLHHAARQGQFAVDIYRIGNPFGPGQKARPGQGVLPHWIEAIHHRMPIRVFGDGSAQRDYIFIDDVCKLMSLSCDRLDQSETFNLGSGKPTSLKQLLELLQQLVPDPPPIEYVADRISDIQSIVLSPERLLKLAGDFEFTPLRDGLQRTLVHHHVLRE